MLRGALYIDGASITRKLQERGRAENVSYKLEYGKFAKWIEKATQAQMVIRKYYTARWSEGGGESRGFFYQHLEQRDFTVIEMMSKQFSKFVDAGENKIVEKKIHADKGVDVAIALDSYIDMTTERHKLDVLVLATHDGDFVPLVERLSQKKIYVVGFSDRMSIELRKSATPLFLDEAEPGVMRKS